MKRTLTTYFMLLGLLAAGCKERTIDYSIPANLAGTGDADSNIIVLPDGGIAILDAGNRERGTLIPGCFATEERCNGVDDDCDGEIDNGFDLMSDPGNCGTCGTICSFPRASSACKAGTCAILECSAGYVDLDKNPVTGCECLQTNQGVEACDGADNDCNGVVDDGVEFFTDPTNCGACGVVCGGANADSSCQKGECILNCRPGYHDANTLPSDGCEYACTPTGPEICDGIDNDCDGKKDGDDSDLVYTPANRVCYGPEPGACQAGQLTCIAGTVVCVGAGLAADEICDGRDNNCDGATDESDPNLGAVCYPSGAAGCTVADRLCKGECKLGAYACTSGTLACQGANAPQLEVCDGKDNDCDGVVDNGFDLDTDVRHCGGCGHACTFPHAISLCQAGVCVLNPKAGQGACEPGFTDANGAPADGCEYACVPDGTEVCDGRDNDCDALVDALDPSLEFPANFCLQVGECGQGPGGSTHAGWESVKTFPVCAIPTGAPAGTSPSWICNYPATVQTTTPNKVIGQETFCDGLDNDCDGVADDPFAAQLKVPCVDPQSTALGACRRQGTLACQADKTLPPACDFGTLTTSASPVHEICDGVDNDCDGQVDESWDNPSGLPLCDGLDCRGIRDNVVRVNASGAPGGSYYIYQYEASRVDASDTSQGKSEVRACSRARNRQDQPVLPWSQVTWFSADAACRAAGMRLCKVERSGGSVTVDEWGFACSFGKACSSAQFPYGCTYNPTHCNGAELSLGQAKTCGALTNCSTEGDLDTLTAEDRIYDLSGNLAEWTLDRRDSGDAGAGDGGLGSAIFTTRGGAFDSFFLGMTCDFLGTQLYPTFSHPDTGFRCCSSCAPGQAECGGQCKNLGTDNEHCGSCGTACTADKSCQNGTCK